MPRYLSPRAPQRIARAIVLAPGVGVSVGLFLAEVVMFLSLGTPGGAL